MIFLVFWVKFSLFFFLVPSGNHGNPSHYLTDCPFFGNYVVHIINLHTYLTASNNFLAMPFLLSDLNTQILLMPHLAGSGSVLQHQG